MTGLDPQIAGIIGTLDAGFPPVHTMTGAQARAAIRSRFTPSADPQPMDSVEDTAVPGREGPVPVRVYRPVATQAPLPILVYAHGGGWVFCDLDSHDELCRDLATRIPAVVVSVHYRRAPEEGRWPAAAEDVYAVTCWAAENADRLGGGTPGMILVGGDSAGGNLAAVTALMARDRGGPTLAGQVLLYPVIAADFDNDSYRRFGSGYYNPTAALRWYWDQYVPDLADRTDPYASPLRADLTGLPPAIAVVAGHDPLRDEGIAYTEALQAAGVPTVQRFFDGGIHGFMTMPSLDICGRARTQVCADVGELVGRIGAGAP